MVNPDAELNRLRWMLQATGKWESGQVEQVIDEASAEINELILDVIESAVAEAIDYAAEIGAEEFIEEIDVVPVGGFYQVSTITGRTDYSTDERKMLPDLLRDAPTNPETGIKSRVIPIGNAGGAKVYGDIFSVLQDRQRKISEARMALIDNDLNNRSERAAAVAARFRDVLARNLAAARPRRKFENKTIQNPEFRTASSNQDPDTQWVYPAKEMDLTGYLMDLNKQVEQSMTEGILFVIDAYYKEFS